LFFTTIAIAAVSPSKKMHSLAAPPKGKLLTLYYIDENL